MLRLPDRPLHVLCVGAHSDDIEIGCGATMLTLLDRRDDLTVTWVVLSGDEDRSNEARISAEAVLAGAAGRDIRIADFKDAYFPHEGERLKGYFEALGTDLQPDLIFTHFEGDRHQDHRLVSELTWNTFRDHFILEYEIPKYDGDLANPSMFVHIEEDALIRKTENLVRHFPSQTGKPWFASEVFRSMALIRGVESRSPTRYAEGFYARKAILST